MIHCEMTGKGSNQASNRKMDPKKNSWIYSLKLVDSLTPINLKFKK